MDSRKNNSHYYYGNGARAEGVCRGVMHMGGVAWAGGGKGIDGTDCGFRYSLPVSGRTDHGDKCLQTAIGLL